MAVSYINYDPAQQLYRVHFTDPNPAMSELSRVHFLLSELSKTLTEIHIGNHPTGRYVGFKLRPHLLTAGETLQKVKGLLDPALTATALKMTLGYKILNCGRHNILNLRGEYAPGLKADEEIIDALPRIIAHLDLISDPPSQEWTEIPMTIQIYLSLLFLMAGVFVQRLKLIIDYTQGECAECA